MPDAQNTTVLFGQREIIVTPEALPQDDLARRVAEEATRIALGLHAPHDLITPARYATIEVNGIAVEVGILEHRIARSQGRTELSYSVTVHAPMRASKVGLSDVLKSLNYKVSQISSK